jgi:DNA-directed RNA polymerase sigma subunit (sigma70/sigma32)
MLTKSSVKRAIPANLPTVKYPDEVVERWNKEAEIARQQIATGELKPMSVRELAVELGLDPNEFDDDE